MVPGRQCLNYNESPIVLLPFVLLLTSFPDHLLFSRTVKENTSQRKILWLGKLLLFDPSQIQIFFFSNITVTLVKICFTIACPASQLGFWSPHTITLYQHHWGLRTKTVSMEHRRCWQFVSFDRSTAFDIFNGKKVKNICWYLSDDIDFIWEIESVICSPPPHTHTQQQIHNLLKIKMLLTLSIFFGYIIPVGINVTISVFLLILKRIFTVSLNFLNFVILTLICFSIMLIFQCSLSNSCTLRKAPSHSRVIDERHTQVLQISLLGLKTALSELLLCDNCRWMLTLMALGELSLSH